MKRLQIMIEEEMDAELERMARERKTSKAALIRSFVRKHVQARPALEDDPLWQVAGVCDFDPEPIDDVVYR